MGQRLVPLLHLRGRVCECRRWQRGAFLRYRVDSRAQGLRLRGLAHLQEPGSLLPFPI